MCHPLVLPPRFLAPAEQEQSSGPNPASGSGDSGVTKASVAAEVGSGTTVVSSWQGECGVLRLCRKALFTRVGKFRDANSQILHKGSLP